MPNARLKYNGGEFLMGSGVTTVGRTPDNFISFPDDGNVSRYHAEIESRGEEYCLIDLGSSNGTTLNGQKVSGETYLKDGDQIAFGGTSNIAFELIKEKSDPELPAESVPKADAASDSDAVESAPPETGPTPAPDVAAGSNNMLMLAGGACALALVFVVVAGGIYYYSGSSSCAATAKIVKPEQGDTIMAATEIEVEAENPGCVSKAVFTIDGVEFASSADEPYTATIDPKEFPDLADGGEHVLNLVLVDENGNQSPQAGAVLLAFETREIKKPENLPTQDQKPTPTGPKAKEVSLIEVQEMSKRLVKQFSGGFAYNVSNKQFLQEVQKKTAEYAQEGYFARASVFRDAINVAYVREQNLDAPLGYLLAMSRSKFIVDKQGGGEGLWKMSSEFVTSNAYNGLCGGEALSDPSQNCAAKASALYMKAIVFGVFGGDVIYSAAAFGKSPQDAGVWKATLPANRSDIWNSIKTPPEREQIVRFFAAGIVAENPQKFGLKKDRPLSELYRLAM